MKQLTRQEVEAIMISFFLKKWHKVGEPKPIYIGTVLEKMQNRDEFYPSYRYEIQGELVELVLLWQPLGLSRSLQETIEESGYDKKLNQFADFHTKITITEKLKSPEANALFSFLQHLI